MNQIIYDNYCKILKAELLPATGCTEPIAVAYAAAKARAVLGRMPDRIQMYCSGNIVKNVMGVTVPNSGGAKGIQAAAILGVIAGDADKELEVIDCVEASQIEQMHRFLASNICECHLAEHKDNLYIRAEVAAGEESASVEIRNQHNHISKIIKNGCVLMEQEDVDVPECGDKNLLNLKDIFAFANVINLEDIRDIIHRQIVFNGAISQEGLANSWGVQVGRTLLSRGRDDFIVRACAAAAAGSDARMSGCPLPVVINSGSGNQGITVCVPVLEYSRLTGCSEERLYRALVLANLISLLQKKFIGNLSAYCGATCAGCAAACGIAYIDGSPLEVIEHTIINTGAIIGGMICDGAKASCAAKIASAVEAGLLGYELAKNKRNFQPGEGVVTGDAEECIRNWGRVGGKGMEKTDLEILKIMLGQ